MSVKLVEVSRSGLVECIHRGDVAVVNSKGELLNSAGDPHKITYMRSSAKPMQTVNVLKSGAAEHFKLTDKEIAVISSSHYAEPFHREAIRSILSKIGLTVNHILGGTVTSLNPNYALRLARDNVPLSPVFSDCSGKHAGMLAVCKHQNLSITDYLSPNHQCQQAILSDIAYFCQFPKSNIHIGIDGCSAPVHALPLKNIALGFARFVDTEMLDSPYSDICPRIFSAMNKYPEMVAGTGGFCTELMKNTHGKLIGKIGAEGVYCIGLKNKGIGIAVKMESGSMAMLPPVVIHVLKSLNVLSNNELKALSRFEIMDNANDLNTVVGKIKPVFELKRL